MATNVNNLKTMSSSKGSFEDVKSSKTRLIGLIGGILIFISVFLPWVSISVLFATQSFSAFDLGKLKVGEMIGPIGVIAGLACIGASFLNKGKTRGLLHAGAGIVALIPLVLLWLSLQDMSNQGGAFQRQMASLVMNMITFKEGLYLYLVSAVAEIIVGVLELKE